jgi:hypothetical protein
MKKQLSQKRKRQNKPTIHHPFPNKYYDGLSSDNKEQQIKELKQSRKLYKKGIYLSRSKKTSFKTKRSSHLVEFENKYGVNISDKQAVYKVTGITHKAQEKILNKGRGAFYSSGSRPNQSAESWALARLASVILKHGAYKVDRHVLIENKCNNIKQPPKHKTLVVKCNKITDNTVHKFKKCVRPSDGKIFELPRRFYPSQCTKSKGFTMRSSCAPFTS